MASLLDPFDSFDRVSSGLSSVDINDARVNAEKHTPDHDYIALGCLCFFPTEDSLDHTDVRWEKIENANYLNQILPKDLCFLVDLYLHHWVQLWRAAGTSSTIIRIYLLPDDIAASTIDRQSGKLRAGLAHLCSRLDVSSTAWNGHAHPHTFTRFDLWASGINRSLFWLFNNLPSPSPAADKVAHRYSRLAVEELLSDDPFIPDLKATLYPYQARTVAAMIQRETVSTANLDPRYEIRESMTGVKYFYNARDFQFRLAPPNYESNRGGMLAETMGVGKTVMCIALILATRFHLPRVPPQFSTKTVKREKVGSLAEMALANAGKAAAPLKSHLHWFYKNSDIDMDIFARAIDASPHCYEIPQVARRSARITSNYQPPPSRQLRLCSTTLVVVPRNLLHQWQAEFAKHVDLGGEDALRILLMERAKDRLPSAEEIAKYDIVLFSKSKFESEIKDGQDDQGRSKTNVRAECRCPYIGATRIRDCSCLRPEDVYSTPLKQLHFLRIIIDEGHEFSSSTSNAVKVATTLVTAERRWVVSGTPAKERLFGVDVEVAGTSEYVPSDTGSEIKDNGSRFSYAIEKRQAFDRQTELNGATKSIGTLLSNFLKVQPWVKTEGQEKVDFEDFAFRHEAFRVKTHSAFSHCMASTLRTLVLKTRPEDVERDVLLPPLSVSVKYLEPSFYDIITLNLFIFFITANAVTSERTDVDYLFHKNSTTARHALIRNLRHSHFFWTGWTEQNVVDAIGHSERYLAKENISCSPKDRRKLEECLQFAQLVLRCSTWRAMSTSHEIAVFMKDWPLEHEISWALDPDEPRSPLAIGVTQLRSAQDFMNWRLFDENPLQGFQRLGEIERLKAIEAQQQESTPKQKTAKDTKMGVPTSGLQDKQIDNRQKASPKKTSTKPRTIEVSGDITHIPPDVSLDSTKRKRSVTLDTRDLPSDSPLAATSMVGTVSSKLSYLLERVLAFQAQEKILIFYDSDNSAWYTSQMLDLFHIKHLIYARHLNPDQKSRYIVSFDTDETIRVLLMDIGQGAWGLNVNKASRVFFLNPPCSPHTEAQAIKRAHRIGQTRPVYVETLVLKGTIEDDLFNRSKRMTREEHENTGKEGKELSNDSEVATIIQNAECIPVAEGDRIGFAQMAPLGTALQVFGRKGRHDVKIKDIDDDGDHSGKAGSKKRQRRGNPQGQKAVPQSNMAAPKSGRNDGP